MGTLGIPWKRSFIHRATRVVAGCHSLWEKKLHLYPWRSGENDTEHRVFWCQRACETHDQTRRMATTRPMVSEKKEDKWLRKDILHASNAVETAVLSAGPQPHQTTEFRGF